MKAQVIKGLMVSNGKTAQNVADYLGLTRNTLYKRLNGRSDFTTTEIIKLCEILNIHDAKQKADIFLT